MPPPITDEETRLIAELRAALGDELAAVAERPELAGDFKLARFLRGYAHDVTQAAEAWRRMMAFLASVNADEHREVLRQAGWAWPYTLDRFAEVRTVLGNAIPVHHGQDCEGNLTTVTSLRRWALNEVVAAGLSEQMCELRLYVDLYFDEMLTRMSHEAGRPLARNDVVDVRQVGVTHFNRAALALLRESGQSSTHFPESVARITAVHFGWLTRSLWTLVRPFLPAQTAAKFQPMADASGLADVFTSETMPARFGGACACEVCAAWPLTCGAATSLDELEEGEVVSLSRRQVETRSVEVPAGHTVAWVVALEAHTLEMRTQFAGERLEAAMVDSKEPARQGVFVAPAAGTFEVVLDNSSSRLRGKRAVLVLKVESPAEAAAAGDSWRGGGGGGGPRGGGGGGGGGAAGGSVVVIVVGSGSVEGAGAGPSS